MRLPGGRRTRALAGAGTGAVGAAWTARLLADRRAIRADPAHAVLSARLEGRELPVVAADGTRLHAEEFGPAHGPPVVLVHGWTCELRFWTCQIQALSADHRVVAYDLRGHGRSGRPTSDDYSIEAHAGDLGSVLEAAVGPEAGGGAGERAVVAGHSLGAMTVVAWAGANPEQVRERLAGAALVNTGMGDLISESFVLRTPDRLAGVERAVGRGLLSARLPLPRSPTPISHRVVRYVALSRSATPAQVAFAESMVLRCDPHARAGCGGTLTELDLHEAVASLEVPTVVVAGEADRLTPPGHARRLAESLPQLSELVELPGSGHMGPVTDADVVTERLRRLAAAGKGASAGAAAAA